MYSLVYAPQKPELFFTALAAVALCGALSFYLLLWFSRAAIALVTRVDYRYLSAVTALVLVALVLALTGPGGLAVALVATGIGLLPVLWGSRRLNCLGVLLLPITLNMAGLGPALAGLLGLI